MFILLRNRKIICFVQLILKLTTNLESTTFSVVYSSYRYSFCSTQSSYRRETGATLQKADFSSLLAEIWVQLKRKFIYKVQWAHHLCIFLLEQNCVRILSLSMKQTERRAWSEISIFTKVRLCDRRLIHTTRFLEVAGTLETSHIHHCLF